MTLNTKSNSWIHGDWNKTQCSKRQYVFSPPWLLSSLTLSGKKTNLSIQFIPNEETEQVKGCWLFLWFLGAIDDGHSIWGTDSEMFSLALISGRLGQKQWQGWSWEIESGCGKKQRLWSSCEKIVWLMWRRSRGSGGGRLGCSFKLGMHDNMVWEVFLSICLYVACIG